MLGPNLTSARVMAGLGVSGPGAFSTDPRQGGRGSGPRRSESEVLGQPAVPPPKVGVGCYRPSGVPCSGGTSTPFFRRHPATKVGHREPHLGCGDGDGGSRRPRVSRKPVA